MENNIFDILTQHILQIFDLEGNEIKFNHLEIRMEKIKHSTCISPTLYADGRFIKSKTHRVVYQCRCGRKETILLVKYLFKKKIHCVHCIQNPNFEDRLIPNPFGPHCKDPKDRVITKSKNGTLFFSNESDEFKKNYEKTHITDDEIIKWWNHIYSINDLDPVKNNMIYFYAVPTNNQLKYTSAVSLDGGNTLMKGLSIKLKCSMCGKIFHIHTDNLKNKNPEKIKCAACSLTNKKFPILMYDDTGITYQGNSEKLFIDLCIKNNIKILNGFEIPYKRNNRNHIYISDFYLPEYKMIIEIKGRNQYYYMDLKSGKYEKKCEASEIFAKENNMKFQVVFGEDIEKFIKNLLDERDSLNNREIY